MDLGARQPVADVLDERSLERRRRGFVAQTPGEGLEDREIRRPFEVQHPTHHLRLEILVETDPRERLGDLAAAIVDPVRLAHEGDHRVGAGGFREQHLGVAGGHDLAAARFGQLADEGVDLTLAEDLQVGVRLVEQQDGARVRVQVGEEEKGLLESPAAGGEVEPDAPLPVAHRDLAALLDVERLIQLDAEEPLDPFRQVGPGVGAVAVDSKAQVAQHLGRAALADADVDRTRVEAGFRRRHARHRRQVGDLHRPGLLRHRHPQRRRTPFEPQRPAVEGLLVRVVELEPAPPPAPCAGRDRTAGRRPLHQHVDADVVGALPPVHRADVPGMQVAPQQIRVGDGYRHQVAAVDRHARALLGRLAARPPFEPPPQADVPQRQRLHRRGLARVVRADQHDGAAQFDLDLLEALEVADRELGEHLLAPASSAATLAQSLPAAAAHRERAAPAGETSAAPSPRTGSCQNSSRTPISNRRGSL